MKNEPTELKDNNLNAAIESFEQKAREKKKDGLKKLVSIMSSGVSVDDIEEVLQMSSSLDFKLAEALEVFKRRQEETLQKVEPYITAHRYFFFVPIVMSYIMFGLVFYLIDPKHIFDLSASPMSKRILLAILYSLIVYFIFSMLCYANLGRWISFLDWTTFKNLYEEKYNNSLSIVFWQNFEICEPEEGYTILGLRNLLKNKYNFKISYDDCVAFLEDEKNIPRIGDPDKQQVMYGIRLKFKQKAREVL